MADYKRLPAEQKAQAELAVKRAASSALVSHLIECHRIAQKADRNNPETLFQCLAEYMELCEKDGTKITNMSAYSACGVSAMDVSNWMSGATKKHDPRYREFAQIIRRVCSEFREQAMVEGLINPAVGIWHQKNYDGFADEPLNVAVEDDHIERIVDPDTIAEKYKHLIDGSENEIETEDN